MPLAHKVPTVCFIAVAMLFFPVFVNASISITEIMYDLEGSDSGREWIEVYNNGVEIDFTSWRFFESETNHKLIPYPEGSLGTISSGSYAVIADNPDKFLIDWPEYSGLLFDSSFSLKNDTETLVIRDEDLIDVDIVTYFFEQGGAGDGNSIQLSGSVWEAHLPTPGEALVDTQIEPESPPPDTSPGEDEEQSYQSVEVYASLPSIKARINSPQSVIAGADAFFSGVGYGFQNKTLSNGRYIWNFGDGATTEGVHVGHIYHHPGRYVAMLTVTSGGESTTASAIVEVKEAKVGIYRADGDVIEISNEGSSPLNLSGWHLEAQDKLFTFPNNTSLLPKITVSFPKQITNLSVSDPKTVVLLYPNGVVATEYEEVKTPKVAYVPKAEVKAIVFKPTLSKVETTQVKKTKEVPLVQESTSSATGNLQNIALSSGALSNDTKERGFSYAWFLGALSVIVLGTVAVIFGHKKKSIADSFKIVEEKD